MSCFRPEVTTAIQVALGPIVGGRGLYCIQESASWEWARSESEVKARLRSFRLLANHKVKQL